MGQVHVSNQSGTSWYPVITASSYKVTVLVMSLINHVTHHYKNTAKIHCTKKQNKSLEGSAISDWSFSCCILFIDHLKCPSYKKGIFKLDGDVYKKKCSLYFYNLSKNINNF